MGWLLFALSLLGLAVALYRWESRSAHLRPAPLNLFALKEQLTKPWPQEEGQALSRDLAQLLQLGWSPQALAAHYLPFVASEGRPSALTGAQTFASPLFCQLWQAELASLTRLRARRLLSLTMALLEMPASLSGDEQEAEQLVGRVFPLSPAADFWSDLALVVDLAFPGNSLADPQDGLAKQVHQLRYVLSKQQSLWVQENYGGAGRTGRQALQAFLQATPSSSYQLGESARLHNKQGFSGQTGQLLQPLPASLKVLVGFHSEFILDEEGQLLNILDGADLKGLVNGASFNYAKKNGHRHVQLDVAPVKPHDPDFRNRVTRQKDLVFRVPQPLRWQQWRSLLSSNWAWNYHNPKGHHAQEGRSKKAHVAQLQRALRRELDLATGRRVVAKPSLTKLKKFLS